MAKGLGGYRLIIPDLPADATAYYVLEYRAEKQNTALICKERVPPGPINRVSTSGLDHSECHEYGREYRKIFVRGVIYKSSDH